MTTVRRLPIPRLETITPEWLSAVLSAEKQVEVASVRTERIAVGVGLLSDLARLHVTYRPGSTGPETFVVKASTTNMANRPAVEAFDFYRREVAFFRDVAHLTSVRAPRCYYADADDDFESIILMEDIQGHTVGDQAAGCTLDQAEALVRELAALHGPLWDRVDSPAFEAVPYHRSKVHGDNYVNFVPAMWDGTAANYPHLIPAELAAARQTFIDALVPLQEWVTSAPRTFVHGDFRLGNVLFSDKPGESPVILDWQTAQRSKGILDVAYLLSQNVEVEDRRAHERHVVGVYCAELAKFGVEYDPEDAFEDYKKASTYLWVCALYAGSVDLPDDAGSDWVTKMIGRSATAIMDFDGISYL
jgi:aminoglycoside phosphotransferase (APT) family kinase protein